MWNWKNAKAVFGRTGLTMCMRWTLCPFPPRASADEQTDRLATFTHLFICCGARVPPCIRQHAAVQYYIAFGSTAPT